MSTKKSYCLTLVLCLLFFYCKAQVKIYVSVNGNDRNPGSFTDPLKTLDAAFVKALTYAGEDVAIEIRAGMYSPGKTLSISSGNYQLRSLAIRPYAKEKVTISGAAAITPEWQPYRNGILKAYLDLQESPDQLFVNGRIMHMARYPNYDSAARVYHGTASDALSVERVKSWKHPAGGYIHALHQGEWGDFHYRITGKDDRGNLNYEGGWQNNRPAPMHKENRFVENIFEELDALAEWFYDKARKTIYLYPPKGINIKKANISISRLTDIIHISGNLREPVKNVSIDNISFTQTARSFMLVKEPLLRSDWAIYRGGAILLDGTENVSITHCTFSELGGNAVFFSNYNKGDLVGDNHIFNIGGNAIAFVGSADAVRSPSFRYELFVPWDEMDYTPGARNNNYPQYCMARGNLVHEIGTIEKQVAGVEISMSSHITVSHNSIYHVPRAGINISEGTWGGHLLEFNDVFNTVLETGDHGAFNSWGRDRYWRPERTMIDSIVAAKPGVELLDVVEPVIIRNNRFQCDHGWDIDLDDGSTNYLIYNNVCLNGGLKLREGYHRTVTNNILINNTFHPHVWLKNSGDVFKHNIVTSSYAPILMSNWGREVDSNFFLTKEALANARTLNLDQHSSSGDAQFINFEARDYTVGPASPALNMGFKNFEMNFGVTLPVLKKIAEKPPVKPLLTRLDKVKGLEVEWLGARFKNIETLGERSAAGLHDNNGALLVLLPPASLAAGKKLQAGDVIVKLGDRDIKSISDLLTTYQSIKWMGGSEVTISRNQTIQKLKLSFK